MPLTIYNWFVSPIKFYWKECIFHLSVAIYWRKLWVREIGLSTLFLSELGLHLVQTNASCVCSFGLWIHVLWILSSAVFRELCFFNVPQRPLALNNLLVYTSSWFSDPWWNEHDGDLHLKQSVLMALSVQVPALGHCMCSHIVQRKGWLLGIGCLGFSV
jgi:hypothetical protein